MAISAVGTLAYATGTTTNTTLSVNPTAVGSILALSVSISDTTITVTGVSGGGVTTWTRIAGPYLGASHNRNHDIWMGPVTTSGAATITLTTSASVAGIRVDRGAQQYSTTVGTPAWAADGAGAGTTGSGDTTIDFPSLTASAAGRLYFGYAVQADAIVTAPGGYTIQQDSNSNVWLHGLSVSGTQAPQVTMDLAVAWSAVAVMITDGDVPPVVDSLRLPIQTIRVP